MRSGCTDNIRNSPGTVINRSEVVLEQPLSIVKVIRDMSQCVMLVADGRHLKVEVHRTLREDHGPGLIGFREILDKLGREKLL